MADAQPLDDATLDALEKAEARLAHVTDQVRQYGPFSDLQRECEAAREDLRYLAGNHASALLHSSREAARLREENRKLRRLCHEATNFVLECRCDSIHLNRDGHDVEVWRDEFAADIRRAALQGEKTDAT
jgi:hypothetical protein